MPIITKPKTPKTVSLSSKDLFALAGSPDGFDEASLDMSGTNDDDVVTLVAKDGSRCRFTRDDLLACLYRARGDEMLRGADDERHEHDFDGRPGGRPQDHVLARIRIEKHKDGLVLSWEE
jgi:hypothetical protein